MQTIFLQFVQQAREAQIGLGVGQVLVCEAGAEGLQIFGELCAPLAVGGEVLDERHVVIRKRAWRLL